MFDADHVSMALGNLHLTSFPSAKIKLDEFFVFWLTSAEGNAAMNIAFGESQEHGKHSTSTSSSSVTDHISNTIIGNPAYIRGEPPRSPQKKSPKKRTQSEMSTYHMQSGQSRSGYSLGAVGDDSDPRSNTKNIDTTNFTSSGGLGFSLENKIGNNLQPISLQLGLSSSNARNEAGQHTDISLSDNQKSIPSNKNLSIEVSALPMTDGGSGSTFVVGAEMETPSSRGPLAARRRSNFDTIPPFYLPHMRPRYRLSPPNGNDGISNAMNRGLANIDKNGPSVAATLGGVHSSHVAVIQASTAGANNSQNPDQFEKRAQDIFEFFAVYSTPSGGSTAMSANTSNTRNNTSTSINQLNGSSSVPLEKFVHATKRLCGLPSFFNAPLVQRINILFDALPATHPSRTATYGMDNTASQQSGQLATLRAKQMAAAGQPAGPGTPYTAVSLAAFVHYWKTEIADCSRPVRFFRLIKQCHVEYITKDDFVPFLQELLHFHPGLDFLDGHDEFQKKYALTVIVRIFYACNTSRTGRLTLKDVLSGDLFRAFMHVDEENDINRVRSFFSYEHFYVLYCRFFELDVDKDTKLTRDDMLKYGDHSLSDVIIDRVFQVGSRVFSDGREGGFQRGGITYPDFVVFMLAEEDKSTIASLSYWFHCCDLDGDGILSPEELQYFYRVQLQRAVNLGQETIHFNDVLCQLVDLINPANPQAITLQDLLYPVERRQLSGLLFDVIFNLQKFLKFETRDPFAEKVKKEDGYVCDWDRFAAMEYQRLSQEDTVYDGDNMEIEDGAVQGSVEVGQHLQQTVGNGYSDQNATTYMNNNMTYNSNGSYIYPQGGISSTAGVYEDDSSDSDGGFGSSSRTSAGHDRDAGFSVGSSHTSRRSTRAAGGHKTVRAERTAAGYAKDSTHGSTTTAAGQRQRGGKVAGAAAGGGASLNSRRGK